MLKRAGLSISALALAAVLLVNFRGPEDIGSTAVDTASRASGSSASTSATRSSIAGSAGSASRPLPTASAPSSAASGTYVGADVPMPYGDVKVQVTVTDGKITDVQALALPAGGHSGRISTFVEPILRSQALAAQSASIDGVSGATFTSRAYAASLQSALDAAGL